MTDCTGINDGDQLSRTLDDAKKLACIAGVASGKATIQTLSYSTEWMKDEYKLLELNKDLLSCLNEGDNIIIRGDEHDDAVLCSKDKTFDLRAADTSNTLLLVPELATSESDFYSESGFVERSVLSCFSSYYEVRLAQPRLERLKNVLEKNAYSNSQDDDEKVKYSTEYLLGLVQASEEELRKGLDNLGALLINGYWRILDENYRDKAFSQILALIEEKNWDWHEVPLQSTCDVLVELYPDFILKYCLETYGSGVKISDDGIDVYSLDEKKVCQYYAEYILRPALGKFNYNDFMEAWEQSVPYGMRINEGYLSGVALTDLKSHPPVIWYFSEKNLPENPSERFDVLFKTRMRWKEKDIVPYLKKVVPPGQKLNSLFLKFARSSTDENGEKLYNSKRPLS